MRAASAEFVPASLFNLFIDLPIYNSLGSGQNVTVTNSPDPIVIQALGSVASLVEEPCAPEKKMENGSHRLPFFVWGSIEFAYKIYKAIAAQASASASA